MNDAVLKYQVVSKQVGVSVIAVPWYLTVPTVVDSKHIATAKAIIRVSVKDDQCMFPIHQKKASRYLFSIISQHGVPKGSGGSKPVSEPAREKELQKIQNYQTLVEDVNTQASTSWQVAG